MSIDALDKYADQLAEAEAKRLQAESEEAEEQEESLEGDEDESELESQLLEEGEDESELLEDDESDEEESEELEEAELYTVKVNGQEKQVTLEELQKGYQLEEDYRIKTSNLANQRRDVETRMKQIDEARQKYDQGLEQVQALLVQQEPNWDELAEKDPQEFVVQKHQHEQRMAVARKLQEERQKVALEQFQQAAKLGEEKLIEAVPELADKEVFEKRKKSFSEFVGDKYGFSNEEITTWVDHRAILMAMDAQKYHQLMAKLEKAKTGKKDGKKVTTTKRRVSRGKVKNAKGQDTKKQVRQDIKQARERGDIDGALMAATKLIKPIGKTRVL